MEEVVISDTKLSEKMARRSKNKLEQAAREKQKAQSKKADKQVIKLEKNIRDAEKKRTTTVDIEERQKIIWKIKKYLASKRFGTYLQKELGIKYSQTQLSKFQISTLQNILSRIRIAVDTKNSDNIYDKMMFSASLAFEKGISPVYDIDGFAVKLFENDEFLNAAEKVKIESELPNIPPSVQMMFIATQTAIVVHEMNKLDSKKDVVVHEEKEEKHLKTPVVEMTYPNFEVGQII